MNPELKEIFTGEEKRQRKTLQLIASENFTSSNVRKALSSVFTNKYAEGYPGARYYNGNEYADQLETYAQQKALKVFGLSGKKWTVNVQPYSGSPANLAVYLALVPKGEKIMAMDLAHGGHLTHGHKVSATGKWWQQVPYGVSKDTEQLDYDELEKIAKKEKPKMIVAGYTAYPRKIDWKRFREIADSVGAFLHVDMSHVGGLVAGKSYPSPFQYADTVMTTTHKTLRGPRGAMIFSKVDERELPKKIDKAVFPGLQGGPHMNQIAALAVALDEALEPEFRDYAKQVVKNARALAKELQKQGLRVVSGGTDSHLVLVDTWMDGNGVSGKVASDALEAAGIVCNKNGVPFDTRPPMDPSGIRLGTAAETTRGKTEEDFIKIAQIIARAVHDEKGSL